MNDRSLDERIAAHVDSMHPLTDEQLDVIARAFRDVEPVDATRPTREREGA